MFMVWFGSVRFDSFRYEPIWCVQLRITCDWFVWGWLVFCIKNKLKLQNWIFIIWWILNQISCLSTWFPGRWLKIIYMHKTEPNRTISMNIQPSNIEHFISTYRYPLFISDHNNNALNWEAYSILCVAQISAIFRIWIELNGIERESSRAVRLNLHAFASCNVYCQWYLDMPLYIDIRLIFINFCDFCGFYTDISPMHNTPNKWNFRINNTFSLLSPINHSISAFISITAK